MLAAERLAGGAAPAPAPSEASSEERLRALAARRVTIEEVYPELNGGRHPVKRCVGDVLEVWADIFCDGHEHIAAVLKYREADETAWRETPMVHYDNDRWTAHIPLTRCTRLELRHRGVARPLRHLAHRLPEEARRRPARDAGALRGARAARRAPWRRPRATCARCWARCCSSSTAPTILPPTAAALLPLRGGAAR